MAGESELATLLGTSDLLNFSNTVRQSDPYGIAGGALSQWKPNNSTWSPATSGLTAFGQSFLSGLLGNYANQRTSDQLGSVINVLPDLGKDPFSVATPSGVDSSAFNVLKGSAILKKAAGVEQDAALQQKFNSDLMMKLLGKKAEVMGEAQGYDALGTAPLQNPNSPQYKANKDIGDIERKYTETLLTGTAAKEAMNINRAATNILEAVKKDNPLAASTAIFEFAKLQDPTGTVREGDELRVSDPGGPLGQLARTFNEIQQKGKLTAEGKAAMRQLVPILQKNTFQQYDQIKSGMLDAAKQYGAEPSRIQYVKPTDLTSYLQDEQQVLNQLPTSIPQGMKAQKNRVTGEIRLVPIR